MCPLLALVMQSPAQVSSCCMSAARDSASAMLSMLDAEHVIFLQARARVRLPWTWTRRRCQRTCGAGS